MNFTFFRVLPALFLTGLLNSLPALGQEQGMASLEGTVVDAETRQPVPGAIISVETITEERSQQRQKIGLTGTFRFTLDPNKNYYLRTEAAGYRYTQEKLIFTSAYATRLYGKIIPLKRGGPMVAPSLPVTAAAISPPPAGSGSAAKPVAVSPASASATVLTLSTGNAVSAATARDRLVSTSLVTAAPATPAKPRATPAPPVTEKTVQTQLKAVQFVQSKAELLPDSQPALDQLLIFLRENPGISIELAGHTDNQGDYDENIALSKRRVEMVKTFLVQHGIETGRISSRGYGSTRPIANNNSEASRRLNRRVEMTILKK